LVKPSKERGRWPAFLGLRAWVFPVFTIDMRLCYFTAFYLVAVGAAPESASGLVVIVRLLLAIAVYEAWGVLVNDYVDRDLDATAGKKTGLEETPFWQVNALFVLLPLAGFLLIPDPLNHLMSVGILALCCILAFIYSAPAGHRLKEKGAWGFVADVILEKPLPSLIIFAYFGRLGWDALILALLYSSIGGFTLGLHQIWDHDTDREYGIGTMAVKLGKDKMRSLYRRVFVPFFYLTVGLTIALLIYRLGSFGLLAAGLLVVAVVALVYLVRSGIVLREDVKRREVSAELWVVYTYVDGPLPTLLGLLVVFQAPVYIPLLVATLASQLHMFRRHYRWAMEKIGTAIRG